MEENMLVDNVDIIAEHTLEELAENLTLLQAIDMMSKKGWQVVRATYEEATFLRDDTDVQYCLWVNK